MPNSRSARGDDLGGRARDSIDTTPTAALAEGSAANSSVDGADAEPRVLPLRPPYSAEVAELLHRMTVPVGKENDPVYKDVAAQAPTIFATVARNAALGETIAKTRTFTHSGSGIPPRQRELLAHRATARLGAEYEWSLHAAAYGANIGLDQDTIDATVTATSSDPRWTGTDALIIRLVDELIDTNQVSDELWSALSAEYDTSALLSLLFFVGLYTAYSWLQNGIRIQVEPGTPRFPHNRENEAI